MTGCFCVSLWETTSCPTYHLLRSGALTEATFVVSLCAAVSSDSSLSSNREGAIDRLVGIYKDVVHKTGVNIYTSIYPMLEVNMNLHSFHIIYNGVTMILSIWNWLKGEMYKCTVWMGFFLALSSPLSIGLLNRKRLCPSRASRAHYASRRGGRG